MSQEVDKERMDQILKLDVPAVLKSMHELEVKLSAPSNNNNNAILETIAASLSKLESRLTLLETSLESSLEKKDKDPNKEKAATDLETDKESKEEEEKDDNTSIPMPTEFTQEASDSMSLEDRLMARMRSEVSEAMLQSEAKIGSLVLLLFSYIFFVIGFIIIVLIYNCCFISFGVIIDVVMLSLLLLLSLLY